MRVTIWDLDYYYSKIKKNKFNPDAMRLSSYHKQLGDSINFVTTEYDIRRPYDIYYVFKENPKTPNPPRDFFLNPHIRWMGKANKARANWKMPEVVMAVRPDYLLYPEKNTVLEKSEQIRLFNSKCELLPLKQDYTNTFGGHKRVILTDEYIWYSSKNNLIKALKMLSSTKKLSFSEPIWIKKLYSDKDIKTNFLNLNLTPGARLQWQPIFIDEFDEAFNFLLEVQHQWPSVSVGTLPIRFRKIDHWNNPESAVEDFKNIANIIIKAKKEGLQIQLMPFNHRLDTPFFFVFERISDWTYSKRANLSWLEFLMGEYKTYNSLNKPGLWPIPFRDLLRQTYKNKELLLLRKKDNYMSENDIPWTIWDEEFKLGL